MNGINSFDANFRHVTEHDPFPWQRELYKRFVYGDFPPSCNLPTAMGKTSVIAIWLLALADQATNGVGERKQPVRLPRRLAYVVNRRTIVDQATREAEKLRENLLGGKLQDLRTRLQALSGDGGDEIPLAISTLRGQFADNGEWSADPARPAIIIGTVDMIGSRLLFCGYRRGFKHRPLHAGFLGQDTLLVHDEAHLEPAFQKLLDTIKNEQDRCKEFRSFHVMALTATPRTDGVPFELSDEERKPPDNIPDPPTESIHVVWRRLSAKKTLMLHQLYDEKDTAEDVAKLALTRAAHPDAAILVFLRRVDDVKGVVDQLKKAKVNASCIQPLTGTQRGLERDRMADPRKEGASEVFARFLKPPSHESGEQWKTTPKPGTVFLVCTSAGEVGVDISADHLVCDLTTFDSMAQRFGRVNRYGDGDAKIDVVYPTKFEKNGKDEEYQARRENTLELLRKLNGDASPKGLGIQVETLAQSLKSNGGQRRVEDVVFNPTPTILPATDILFDAWALTSIRERMPGRPEVAPYLHGIAEELPQTTLAWRAELDLFNQDTDRAEVRKAFKTIFTKHRIRPHETLTTNSYRVIAFLKEACKKRPALRDTRLVLIFSRDLDVSTIGEVIDNPVRLNVDPTLVLPAKFGGLDSSGMLSAGSIFAKSSAAHNHERTNTPDDDVKDSPEAEPSAKPSLDVADQDGYERAPEAASRKRIIIERTEEGWTARAMPGEPPLPENWNLGQPNEKSTPLVNRIQEKFGLKVKLVQTISRNEEGDPIRALVCLSPPPRQQGIGQDQNLDDHVSAVEKEAARLADALLGDNKIANAALRFAAQWHDEGKKADRWQRYIGGAVDGRPLGKATTWRDAKCLAGYRHEFGSLLRIPDDEARSFFADQRPGLTAEEQEQARDLALHMIGSHHGHNRPHFACILDDDFKTTECEQTHLDAVRRFARLQRRYGRWGLAYLESLLRAADAAASRAIGLDPETDDDDDTSATDGGEQ